MKESVRIIRFMIVGTSNACIVALIVWILMDLLAVNYIVANMVGYTAALIHNFFWSKYWVFSSRGGNVVREALLFLLAFGCAYLTQFVFLILMVEYFGQDEYLSQFLGLFFYGLVNFLMNKFLTFRIRKAD